MSLNVNTKWLNPNLLTSTPKLYKAVNTKHNPFACNGDSSMGLESVMQIILFTHLIPQLWLIGWNTNNPLSVDGVNRASKITNIPLSLFANVLVVFFSHAFSPFFLILSSHLHHPCTTIINTIAHTKPTYRSQTTAIIVIAVTTLCMQQTIIRS